MYILSIFIFLFFSLPTLTGKQNLFLFLFPLTGRKTAVGIRHPYNILRVDLCAVGQNTHNYRRVEFYYQPLHPKPFTYHELWPWPLTWPLNLTSEHVKRHSSLFDVDFWPMTLSCNHRLCKVAVELNTKKKKIIDIIKIQTLSTCSSPEWHVVCDVMSVTWPFWASE